MPRSKPKQAGKGVHAATPTVNQSPHLRDLKRNIQHGIGWLLLDLFWFLIGLWNLVFGSLIAGILITLIGVLHITVILSGDDRRRDERAKAGREEMRKQYERNGMTEQWEEMERHLRDIRNRSRPWTGSRRK